jgi:hypothetical protein
MRSVPRIYIEQQLRLRNSLVTGVEVGSSTSTVALRFVDATKREPNAWGYNWAPLFLGDTNTGTWPYRLEESRISDSKIWS